MFILLVTAAQAYPRSPHPINPGSSRKGIADGYDSLRLRWDRGQWHIFCGSLEQSGRGNVVGKHEEEDMAASHMGNDTRWEGPD